MKLSRWRHWLNFSETNGAAPRSAKSALQRSRLYWQLHQLWKSFELHERSKLDELARAVMIGRVIAIFYHFLISVFSLFHWELCTTLNPHSTLANSQPQHQATSCWRHDDALVRCSHAQQQPFRTLRSSKNEPQQRENEKKKKENENTNACYLFQLGWLLPTLHGSFLAPDLTIAWVITTSRWARKLDHSKKVGSGKPCFSDAELACRLALQGRKQLVLGANAAVTRCLRRVFLRSSSIKLGFRDVSDSISLSQAVLAKEHKIHVKQSCSFMKCAQWRQMVNFTVPNWTCKLHTTAETIRVWWHGTYQVDTKGHSSWACAPNLRNCIKGGLCNVKTVEWKPEFLPTFLAEHDFEELVSRVKLSLMRRSMPYYACPPRPTQRLKWSMQLEEVDQGIQSDAVCQGWIVRWRLKVIRRLRENESTERVS